MTPASQESGIRIVEVRVRNFRSLKQVDVNLVVGMTEGTFSDYRAKGEALKEEKRNMFVATTRARRILVFSYPRTKKMPWGDIRKQEPSQYLKRFELI